MIAELLITTNNKPTLFHVLNRCSRVVLKFRLVTIGLAGKTHAEDNRKEKSSYMFSIWTLFRCCNNSGT
jgi:hypothetical protein